MQMLQKMKNQEHERAKYAFERVKRVATSVTDTDADRKKYRSAALSAGIMVHTSGLLPSMAFYLDKLSKPENTGHKCLFEDIACRLGVPVGTPSLQAYNELLGLDNITLMKKTQEAIALLIWIKRFAEAMITKDGTALE